MVDVADTLAEQTEINMQNSASKERVFASILPANTVLGADPVLIPVYIGGVPVHGVRCDSFRFLFFNLEGGETGQEKLLTVYPID